MVVRAKSRLSALKEFVMRYYPAAIALSLTLAVTASMGQGAERKVDPRAAMLLADGRAQLDAGEIEVAVDSLEAALALDPGSSEIYIELAQAARQAGLYGKAIRYFRSAEARDPGNLAALSGEGASLLEKGAIEKAKENLSKLESICGRNCEETQQLAALISRGPKPRVLAAEAITPETVVTQN